MSDLFDDRSRGDDAAPPVAARGAVGPAAVSAEDADLAQRLHERFGGRCCIGTSSWHFPGWAGRVYDRAYPEALLSRDGLSAYAMHPLLRCVSLDRALYRPLAAAEYAALAQQVPPHFRFVVKAPALVSDAMQRDRVSGAGASDNAGFLDPGLAFEQWLRPAVNGLGSALGVLVLQLAPLPVRWLQDTTALHRKLAALFEVLTPALPAGALLALEVRDAALLDRTTAGLLREAGVRAVLGLHPRLPAIDDQLPMQRALWPGDLVCRWNLQRGWRYEEAREAWRPFDRLLAPDMATRATLARVARATLDAGHRVFVTINNKAEGSAPASVQALAHALLQA